MGTGKQSTFAEDSSVKAAGVGYVTGDVLIILRGLFNYTHAQGDATKIKASKKLIGTGLAWGIGGVFPAVFGNPKAETQQKLLAHKLGKFLKKEGIEIPDSPDLAELTKEGGLVDKVKEFLFDHPTDMLNLCYLVGSVFLASKGWREWKSAAAESNYASKSGLKKILSSADFFCGILVGIGSTLGLLVREKQHAPGEEKQKSLANRLASGFYLANNAFTFAGAADDFMDSRSLDPTVSSGSTTTGTLRLFTGLSYVFSNVMLSLSPKGAHTRKKDKTDVAGYMAEMAAQVIAVQTPENQAVVREKMQEHLAQGLDMKVNEFASLLDEKLPPSRVNKQPAPQGSWQNRTAQTTDIAEMGRNV